MIEPAFDLDRSDAARDAPLPLPATFQRRILFALSGAERPTASLERTREVARLLSMELHVLQVLSELGSLSSASPHGNVVESIASIEGALALIRATPAWLDAVLGGDFARDNLEVRTGTFVAEVVEYAAHLNASLIVVGATKRRFGAMVTRLARASGRPVLVLRDPTSKPSILAATDLEDARLPVLRSAADFGEQLHARVVAFHNLTPLAITTSPGSASTPIAPVPDGLEIVLRKLRLSWASRELHLAGETIASESDPADAIVQTARAKDIDLVVVGARALSQSGRFSLNSIAIDVVNRARSSVLVIPLDRAVESMPDVNRGCA